jgi:ABC-type multidrug transport system ATPase subunit
VLCTHFLGEAGRLASRMAVLFSGRLHAFGTPAELAGELWTGTEVRIDLGRAPAPDLLTRLGTVPGVVQAVPVEQSVLARVESRQVVPALVAACVGAGEAVYAAEPRTPSLEDVYFEIEARAKGGAAA